MIDLRLVLAKTVMLPKSDGTGYETCRVGEHRATLQIGNVSLAFDGHNNWDSREDCRGEVIELMEHHDYPVRLRGGGVARCDSVAESLLYALAADLGYFVTPVDDDE
jgi:hypothetical protein